MFGACVCGYGIGRLLVIDYVFVLFDKGLFVFGGAVQVLIFFFFF